MPTSWHQAIPVLMEKIIMESPVSVLDIGVGFGKYGTLLREELDIKYERCDKKQWTTRIDGIEVFGGYRNPVHDYVYDNVFYQPVTECVDSLGRYDVVMLIDTIQHFEKEDGVKLLKKLLSHTGKALIVSTPINPAPQEGYMGNTFEAHRSRWTPVDFAGFEADYTTLPIEGNQALIVKLYPTHITHNPWRMMDEELIRLLQPVREEDEKLHIAYVMPHQSLCGGLKMLVEQIRWLKSKGHTVDAYLRGWRKSALPEWMPAEVDSDTVIPACSQLSSFIEPCDVIVSSWYEQIHELLPAQIPVLFWEQGSEPLFGDYRGVLDTREQRNAVQAAYAMPVALASVSDFMADVLDKRYNRKPFVITNGIDTDLFLPSQTRNEEPVILLVGNPQMPMKRFPIAFSVLSRLWNEGYRFRVSWICQTEPDYINNPFSTSIYCNPPQELLPRLYAQSDILLFPSLYEGFGMPPLEAMAAGLAVVCSDCGGPSMYAVHEHNALVFQPEDQAAMFAELARLLVDKALRDRLSVAARETALNFSLNKSFSKLEELLYAIKNRKMNRTS